MKKILSILLIVVILFAMQSIFVFAETVNTPTVEDLGNGYYTVTVIENVPTPNALFAASTNITKSKTTYFKNKNNETLWYVKVTGTFTYDGTTSKCLNVTPAAQSYVSAWKTSGLTGSKSLNTATASVVGKLYVDGVVVQTVPKAVTLTCSPTGKFS